MRHSRWSGRPDRGMTASVSGVFRDLSRMTFSPARPSRPRSRGTELMSKGDPGAVQVRSASVESQKCLRDKDRPVWSTWSTFFLIKGYERGERGRLHMHRMPSHARMYG